jgi:hypothetical protein
MKQKSLVVALILSAITSMAIAQTNNPPEGGNGQGASEHRHGPPPAAIDSCKGKTSGAACSFLGRENKTRTGTCFAPPSGNFPLACRPERGAGGQNH